MFYDQNAAMGVVGNAIGGVAQHPAPKFGVVTMANYDQVIAALPRKADDDLGRVARASDATDLHDVAPGGFHNLFFALFKAVAGGLILAFGFTG